MIISYFIWGFIVISLVVFSWLFLFVYKYLYFAIVQEVAIINLQSQLTITKVQKADFDNLLKKSEEKKNPTTTIIFDNIPNPFKSQ